MRQIVKIPLGLVCIALIIGYIWSAPAQTLACFATEDIAGWAAGDLPLLTPGGSRSLAENVTGDFELCSIASGFGDMADSHRYLIQRSAGDFTFRATIYSINDVGTAGVIARWDEQWADGAHIRISAHPDPTGGYALRSGVRLDNGSSTDNSGTAAMSVSLPVTLRISRKGSIFTTAYAPDGANFIDHLVVDSADRDLNAANLVVGLAQASESLTTKATAVFGQAGFAAPKDPPPDISGCLDMKMLPLAGNQPLTLEGINLDSVQAASIAGIPANIVGQTPQLLTLQPRPAPLSLTSGDVVLTSAWGESTVGANIIYAGEPFIRGDLDGNGRVNEDDITVLEDTLLGRHSPYHCLEAADINNDDQINTQDVSDLNSYLQSGSPIPPAPFPTAGLPPRGSFSCGLPPAPTITSLLDSNGVPLPGGTTLSEGDEIIITGGDFPANPDQTQVMFGNVRTQIVPLSTADTGTDSLRVRILAVPDNGNKCPIIFQDSSTDNLPTLDPASSEAANRLGVSYGVSPDAERADLCPAFMASELTDVTVAEYRAADGSQFLPFDPAKWQPTDSALITLDLLLPVLAGESRGSRSARFTYTSPFDESAEEMITQLYLPLILRGTGDTAKAVRVSPDVTEASNATYAAWLTSLAQEMTLQLNGGQSPDCGCDAKAEAMPDQGGIVIKPCDPQITLPPVPPDPPLGDDLPLKPVPPPLWTANAWKPPSVSCNNVTSFEDNPRQWVWCNFADVIAPDINSGLPKWEHYIPKQTLYGGPQALPQLGPPDSRPPNEKYVMYSTGAYNGAFAGGYMNACAAAARHYYCGVKNKNVEKRHMPEFYQNDRVVKTFWLAHSKLPASADPNHYYSYQPPQGERQYLAGLHVNFATGEHFDYWRWATFWVPKPIGETKRKDGTDLYFNPLCDVGTGIDKPANIDDPWTNYVMCADGAPGESNCGNPWGPPNECTQGIQTKFSCSGCHKTWINFDHPELNNDILAVAWLPSLTDQAGAQACFNEIVAANLDDGVTLYKHLAPGVCQ